MTWAGTVTRPVGATSPLSELEALRAGSRGVGPSGPEAARDTYHFLPQLLSLKSQPGGCSYRICVSAFDRQE